MSEDYDDQFPDENNNYFIVGFGTEGLEILLDVTKWADQEATNIMAKLAGDEIDHSGPPIGSIRMRCRFNSHRQIELYGIKTCTSWTTETFEDLFENGDEEYVKGLLRNKGVDIGY